MSDENIKRKIEQLKSEIRGCDARMWVYADQLLATMLHRFEVDPDYSIIEDKVISLMESKENSNDATWEMLASFATIGMAAVDEAIARKKLPA